MDSQAFDILMSKMAEQKADYKEDMGELRQEIREIKTMIQESRDFRMKVIGGSIGVSALIGILWHLVELLTNMGGHG